MAKKRASGKTADKAANPGFEQKMWLAADKLRSNMDAGEYKHVVLGLILLKDITGCHSGLVRAGDTEFKVVDGVMAHGCLLSPKESMRLKTCWAAAKTQS